VIAPLLSLHQLSKTYPGVRALRGVSFDLRAGEVHALLGENGAGKSTLIKIITGMVAADPGGELRVDGHVVSHPHPRRMQHLGIAAVYQNPTLFEELTVAENLRLDGERGVISWRARRAAARRMLARIGAQLDVDRPVRELRMAEKQLLEIARALERRARVLILDEPTASLPHHDAEQLLAIVEQLRREDVGIIYISHRLEEVLRLADRVTVLRDGSQVATGDRTEFDRARMISLMAGRDLAELFPKATVAPGDVILETRGLTCAAAGVRDVSFTLRRGEIVGLAGLVGAGRTELARTLFGLTPAEAGDIVLEGRPAAIRSVGDAVAHGLAYVPEDRKAHGVVEDLPIAENISLAILRRLRTPWLDDAAERRLAADYHRRLAIKAPTIDVTARTLSGGNQQKVALARWLSTQPKILILDEPTQGIDVGAKAEIHRLMGELAQQGLAILLISSELPELLGMADRIVVMRRGRVAGELPAASATRETVLHLAMEDAA
jgi:rhamnose transport system ATP-binding protein